jgi:hypothetical protein
MTADELKDLVRSRVRDTEPDYIFSDADIYHAIAEAQHEAAEDSLILYGEVPLIILANEDNVELPAHVLNPLRVRYDDRTYEVKHIDWYHRHEGFGDPWGGAPVGFFHDLVSLYIRPVQTTDVSLILQANLAPRRDPSDSNPVLEIPSRFHYALATGAVYHLMKTLDADMEDDRRLKTFLSLWGAELARMRKWAARRNRTQRTVKYGGLPHGKRIV